MEPIDELKIIMGKQDEFLPSKGLLFVGGGDFKKIGEEFLNHFIQECHLMPHDKVLDVGCGIGRMAVPLTRYMNQEGKYEGFDVFPEGIKWCKKRITKKYPNFQFQLANIFNGEYNPGGKLKASEYSFPYEDRSFDFVFATSLFTHLVPDDLENYISEISRVLKKEGRCLLTFFLINKISLELGEKGKNRRNFIKNNENYFVENKKIPEQAIAYKEECVLAVLEKNFLQIKKPIKYGSWSGRSEFLSAQDIIVAIKK